MRISTSPYMVSSKGFSSNIVSPVSYNSSGTRSSSLTNSDILHKRLISDRQLNQNSYLILNDSSKYYNSMESKHQAQKNITNQYGILENQNTFEQKMNNMIKSIQQINKKLARQGQQIKNLQNNLNQNQVNRTVLQKIHQQIQVKIKEENTGLLTQIKKINTQIYQRIQQIKNIKLTELNVGSISALNDSGIFQNNEKPVNYQLILKKIKLVIDQKINSEIFKFKLFVQNQIFKNVNLLKTTQSNQSKTIFTKSTLKYSFKPLKLVEKQVLYIQHNENNILSKIKDKQTGKNNQKHEIEVQSSKQVYHIDQNGYLLDQQGFYLLDKNSKMIKVPKKIIQKLKEMKVLK